MTGKDILALLKDERFCNYCLDRNAGDVMYWEQWLEQHPEERAAIARQKKLVLLLNQEVATREIETQFDILKKRIASGGTSYNIPVRRSYATIIRISLAASLLVAIVLTWLLYHPRASVVKPDPTQENIGPGGYLAVLTLSDGTQIDLGRSQPGYIASQTGYELFRVGEGALTYRPSVKPDQKFDTGWNVLTTPNGGQFQVQLPDSTIVYLNATSSLRYPVAFAQLNERRVQLSGEALFKVRHDARRRFTVVTDQQTIEDKGTVFAVMSYPDEPLARTVLVNGLVTVKTSGISSPSAAGSLDLKPGQEATCSKNATLKLGNADTSATLAWTNGSFYFRNADIKTVMRQIARWYNIEVRYAGDITTDTFNGRIARTLPLIKVLERLESTQFVHFQTKGRTITVIR